MLLIAETLCSFSYLWHSSGEGSFEFLSHAPRATFSRQTSFITRQRRARKSRRNGVENWNRKLSAGGNRNQTEEGVKCHLIATESSSQPQKIIKLIAFVFIFDFAHFSGLLVSVLWLPVDIHFISASPARGLENTNFSSRSFLACGTDETQRL